MCRQIMHEVNRVYSISSNLDRSCNCRQSIDMFTRFTPPSLSFLRGASLNNISSSLSVAYKRPSQALEHDSSLSHPLISPASVDEENKSPSPKFPAHLSASSCAKFSVSEFPALQEQCSFLQATFNGKWHFPRILLSTSSRSLHFYHAADVCHLRCIIDAPFRLSLYDVSILNHLESMCSCKECTLNASQP